MYVIVGPITRLFRFLRIILCSRWPVRKGSTKEWSVKEMIDWGENKRTKKLLVSQVAQSVHCSTFIKLKICEDGWDICGLDKELCKRRNPRNCFEHSSGFASSDSSDFFYFFLNHLTVTGCSCRDNRKLWKDLTVFWWFLQRTLCTNLHEEEIFRICGIF